MTKTGKVWSGTAPAKVNLYLHVVGWRDDGYHLLDSLVAFADVGDVLTLEEANAPRLTVTGPFGGVIPAGEDNLALRAVRRLAAAVGRPDGIAVTLDKRLPVAAGIGGGSADAAAVLRGLATLWDLARDDPRLADVAAGLGADVPVCLAGRTAWLGGIGERLDPGPDLAGMPILLVNPGVPLSTPDVFRARSGGFSAEARFAEARPTPERLCTLLAGRGNDLAAPAMSLAPVVGEVLAALAAQPGCRLARMSGSGATCFGLFDTSAAAKAAEAALAGRGWWAAAAALL
ncbi:4-(cytidine 5'-diphospho)-2-C-methyl-D-erythritol kinase [Inquilinus limosus]|uniref:4-(cytidine 5'-diphospho)-2-C-methyl-D-erythritol kinase n=1 Tax=Inquilinus limosus TaxID=171674 RepID=UPI003F15313F